MNHIAGLDISTKRIDVAIIPIDTDTPQTINLRGTTIEVPPRGVTPLYRRVERARNMSRAIRELFRATDVIQAVVECPRGRFRNDALTGTFDSVVTAIPQSIAVMGIEPLEWRRELNLKPGLTKPEAIREAVEWRMTNTGPGDTPITEHEAEALLIALAGRQLLWKHAA